MDLGFGGDEDLATRSRVPAAQRQELRQVVDPNQVPAIADRSERQRHTGRREPQQPPEVARGAGAIHERRPNHDQIETRFSREGQQRLLGLQFRLCVRFDRFRLILA